MKKDEILRSYPDKSFSYIFAEKVDILKGVGTPEENINSKKLEYKKLFEYDSAVLKLKNDIINCEKDEVDEYISSRIIFHFLKISNLILWVHDLNLADVVNVGSIFRNFDIKLKESGFIGDVAIRTNNRDVSIGKTVADIHIEEIMGLSKELSNFNFYKDSNIIKEAVNVANKIIKNKAKYNKATTTVENWIKAEGKSVATSLSKKSDAFDKKAEDYKSERMIGNAGWFVGGLLFGLIALVAIAYFIYDLGNNNDISLGFALMRISVLFIIFYFAFFMLSQFSNNKKLYEAYKFKAIALETMEELVKSYDKDGDRERILNEAISIIFNEPKIKEGGDIQKKLLNDLMDIVKKKV